MKSEVKGKEKNIVTLEIRVDKEKFDEALEKAYRKNVKQIAIPGFRKGKAPRKFIEKFYGAAVFYEDAVNFACPPAYEAAVEEHKLMPVDQPEIEEITEIGEGKDLVFTMKVTVKPEFELPEYKGIKLDKIEHKVLVKDVDAEIDRMREQNARLVDVEGRAIKKGDIAVIDYEGFCDGVAFEGGKGENHSLEIGSGQFIPGFEDQLIGKKLDEDVTVSVKFPEEYHAEDLKGKDAEFKVKIKGIKKKELPAKDDEFAKDVSEFDTFDELKADVRAKLEENAKTRTQREKEDKVLEQIAEKTEIDIPECMINAQADRMLQEFAYNLSSQGLSLDQYRKFTGGTLESIRDQFKERAATAVKGNLILEKIAEAEKIEATDEDIDKELQKMADMYKMEIEKVRELMASSLDGMKNEIVINKTLEFLVDKSTVKRAKKKGVNEDESGTGGSGADK